MPNESIKRSSVHNQTPGPSNEKVSSSRENGNVRMQEKGSPVKSEKPGRQTGSDQQAASTGASGDRSFVSPMHLVNRHKPWPRRKTGEVEEVVKHMPSVVPHHLQRMEKGDSVQEKALNIGVLDWERLERLAYGHLPSSRNTSPPSIIVSSSQPSRSNGSPLVQRKQSPTRDADRSSSAGGRRSKLLMENKYVQVTGSPDAEKFDGCEEHSYTGNLHLADNLLQDQFSSFDSMLDHLGESIQKRRFSFDSAINEPTGTEVPVTNMKIATKPRRDLSPRRLFAAGLNRLRSNSVEERSSRQQMSQTTASVCSTEDCVAGDSKGRRSPLRRMLGPLLKSKKNHMQFSWPIVSLASHQGSEVNIGIDPPTGHASEPRSSGQDESRTTSTRQAVLKLAWRNGLPLFMFFSDNNNVLAATVGRRSVSEEKDCECLYMMFTAREVKKKGGARTSQGSKSKKQGLAYDVVGHIRASFLIKPPDHLPMSGSGTREFILFGSDSIPTSEKHFSSHFNSELAAIFIKATSVESYCPENLAKSSIVAVLPKGAHGLSSEGEPSRLIERWTSGGSCDCGGWDEGCMLSVLSEHRDSTSARACNMDGTRRIELFAQASEARADKQAFSMDTFEEGVYTVDFRGSVCSVQAFAICVAILHSRKSTNLSGLQYSGEAQNLQQDAFPDYTEMVSTKARGEDPPN